LAAGKGQVKNNMTEDRKMDILNSAGEVFSKYGFHGAKIEDIAKEAGIGKGTIYGYFDSKESLFYEMIKYGIEEYEKGMEKALNIDGSIRDKLIYLCRFHGDYLNRYIDITQIVMTEKEVLPKKLMTEILMEKAKLFNRMVEIIKNGIDNGELRKDLDPELGTIIIIGSMNQFYGQKMFYENIDYRKICPEDLIDTVLGGLM